MGLESGADDYMTKPFGIRERSRGSRRSCDGRIGGPRISQVRTALIERRNVLIDIDKRIAVANGHVVELTKLEFEVLHLLLSRPGIVFSRVALLSMVWGGDTFVTHRTVDTLINRLRSKLEVDPHHPELILTAWGVGYKCSDAVEEPRSQRSR